MLRIGGQKVPTRILLLIASDAILIVAGLLVAVALRFHQDAHSFFSYIRGPHITARFALVVIVCELALYYHDLFDSQVISRHSELLVRLLQALGAACLVLAITYYLVEDLSLGRGIAILAAPAILALILSWRLLLDATRLFHYGPERVLVVGTGPAGISLVREILSRAELNMKVVGFLDEMGENIGTPLVNPGIIGGTSEVEDMVAREKIDRVILSLAERRGKTPVRQLLQLKFSGVGVEDAHSFNERLTGRILLEHLSPSWLILSDGFCKSGFLTTAKRTTDIILSLIALIINLPILAVVAAAIWLETGRPILFRQKRTGLGGREFEILKFRSMCQNAEPNGPSWTANDDARITSVGRFIRNCRLDELPQLFNVLRGEMSLVGPRPERPYFCRLLEETIPFFALRHSVRPGITGWAQIKYKYGASIEEAKTKLEYDLFYIKHLSILLDVVILFETAKVVLWGRGAK
jgi:sugar transferase (PEP-CTERM system associated)